MVFLFYTMFIFISFIVILVATSVENRWATSITGRDVAISLLLSLIPVLNIVISFYGSQYILSYYMKR